MAIAYVCDRCEKWAVEDSHLTAVDIPGDGLGNPPKKIAICRGCVNDLRRWAEKIPRNAEEANQPRLREAKKS